MARSFNGTTDYIELASAVLKTKPLTIAGWFNSTAVATQQCIAAVSRSTTTIETYNLSIGVTSGTVTMQRGANGIFGNTTTAATWLANTWNHAAGSIKSNGFRSVYLNGANKVSGNDATSPRTLNVTNIGCKWTTIGTRTLFMTGLLAEVGIWNRALSDDEIGMLARQRLSPLFFPSGLICYESLLRDTREYTGKDFKANGTRVANHPPGIVYPIRFPNKLFSLMPVPSIPTSISLAQAPFGWTPQAFAFTGGTPAVASAISRPSMYIIRRRRRSE